MGGRVASVVSEVLPLSTSHVAASMEAALTAVESVIACESSTDGYDANELVLPHHVRVLLCHSVQMSDRLYGGSLPTWRRLTAARLEAMARNFGEAVVAAVIVAAAGNGDQDNSNVAVTTGCACEENHLESPSVGGVAQAHVLE